MPHEVGLAVAVEAALPDHRPPGGDRAETRRPQHHRTVHQPYRHIAAARIDPGNVALAIAVEVVGGRGRYPPDLVTGFLGEPQCAAGPRRDAKGSAVRR